MTLSLWGWQDEAAERLRREGKADPARFWDEFGEVVGDQGRLERAAQTARDLTPLPTLRPSRRPPAPACACRG